MWNASWSKITVFTPNIIPAVIVPWGSLWTRIHYTKKRRHIIGYWKGWRRNSVIWLSAWDEAQYVFVQQASWQAMLWWVGLWKQEASGRSFLMCSSACYIWGTQMECTILFLVFWIQWVLAVPLNIYNTDLFWKQQQITTITSLDFFPKKSHLYIQTKFRKPKCIFFITASLLSSVVSCSLTPLLS